MTEPVRAGQVPDNMLELTRQGAVEMHMIFEENKRHVVPYNTPYGQLAAGDRDPQSAGRRTRRSDLRDGGIYLGPGGRTFQ